MGSSQVNNLATLETWDDEKYNGLVLYDAVVATGSSVNKGELIFQNTAGTWQKVDASSDAATKLLGVALDTASSTSKVAVLLNGIYSTTYHKELGTITPGLPLYISLNLGQVTEVAPTGAGEYVRLIGHNIAEGVNVVVVRFDPDCTWIEL